MTEEARRARRDGPATLIGLVEIVSAVPAAIFVFLKAWKVTLFGTSSLVRFESEVGVLPILLTLIFVATAYAGWRLLKGDKLGYYLSAGLISVQMVRVVVPGFQFEISCPISLGLGWILDGPGAGPAFVSSYGLSFWLAWAPTVSQPCVSVNGIALLALLYLLLAVRRAVGSEVATAQPGVEPDRPSARGLAP